MRLTDPLTDLLQEAATRGSWWWDRDLQPSGHVNLSKETHPVGRVTVLGFISLSPSCALAFVVFTPLLCFYKCCFLQFVKANVQLLRSVQVVNDVNSTPIDTSSYLPVVWAIKTSIHTFMLINFILTKENLENEMQIYLILQFSTCCMHFLWN